MDIKMFILTNRPVPRGYSEIYYPLYLGGDWDERRDDAIYEDTGINIADRHELYADLGGFYWVWKNITADVVGITQYRKYFFSERQPGKLIQKEEIQDLFSTYDILVPSAFSSIYETIYEKYANHMHIEDLNIARDILAEMHPSYLEGFDLVMSGYHMYGLNMWIARKSTFDSYCNWIFPILAEAEKRIHTENYTKDMKRACAFLSEYLFSVWLLHENLRVYELPIEVVIKKGMAPTEEFIRRISDTEEN